MIMFNIILPKMILKVERWKWNKEYRVYVSTLGNFKDEHKQNMPVKINSSGYLLIETPYGRKLAHRLVMLTWKPIPNAESLTVDHLNHNKRDNSVYNLEWVTREENFKRATQDLCQENSTLEFNNVDEACDWIFNNIKAFYNNPNKNFEKTKKRLIEASEKHTKYFDKYWIIKGE